MLQFVPMTDDVLYRAEDFPGPLVPYRCGLQCWHQLRVEPMPPPVDANPVAAEDAVSA